MAKPQNYNKGLEKESRIRAFLDRIGFRTLDSTKKQNILEDIDCLLGSITVSIKAQDTAAKTGNLCFELEVLNRKTREWEKSWYHNGSATDYVIAVKKKVFHIKKKLLQEFVNLNGWDRVTQLKHKTAKSQAGHLHMNAKIGLVKLQKLIDEGIAVSMGEMS